MKPRVFIGSSTEHLEVANAIQENLDYDGYITIWNQGIFNLSSTALDDLLEALDNFDFAIFVFQPDDITTIREIQYRTVRDNIIFELGLFFGRLGKERVFYITPRSIEMFHLPTDLIGITAGTYNDKREDGNIQASLGPFCSQVRDRLKKFIYESVTGFDNESIVAKTLVVEKPEFWEYLLTIELLKNKLESVNRSHKELLQDVIIQRKKSVDRGVFLNFVKDSFATLTALGSQFVKCLQELTSSFGKPGVPGNSLEIKNAVDRIIQLCNELLAWHYDLNSLEPEGKYMEAKEFMKSWSNIFIEEINKITPSLSNLVNAARSGTLDSSKQKIELVLGAPQGIEEILDCFNQDT